MICSLGPQVEGNSHSVKLLVFVFDPRLSGQHHLYRTSQHEEINIPFTRLSLVRDSFPNLAIKLFNRPPANIKVLDATKFESVMKDFLNALPLYSINEFFEEELTTCLPPFSSL
ncbi:hypothetical protein J6590_050085 [Homalodisca vitripennis]|nr:hypothetical protein J6590_050085 [Homalodisca vitripennis]